MKILVDIGHPAHVHLFRNFIQLMREKGNTVLITARDKDVSFRLLEAYGLDYTNRGKGSQSAVGKILGLLDIDHRLYQIAKPFKPDVLLGVHNPYTAQVSRLLGTKSVTFTDTEHAKLAEILTYPFTDYIFTPSCFKRDLGPKQVRYNGYHELAYLHPNHFKPDKSILDDLNVNKDENFFIIRFVSWGASHDLNQKGLTSDDKQRLIKKLNSHGRVMITSESPLPREFERYRLNIAPEKIHDAIYYASLYLGEGATMATEAAILGTPSIFINSLVGTMGNFIELEKYGLVHSFKRLDDANEKVNQILSDKSSKTSWRGRSKKLVREKMDVTAWMVDKIISLKQ